MSSTLYSLSIDTADAAKLARFWADVLGRRVAPGASAESAAIDPADSADGVPRLSFHRVPEPKSVKNRLHLDLVTTDFEAESERLTALGATALANFDKGAVRWTTFVDPEGNEFDLVAG